MTSDDRPRHRARKKVAKNAQPRITSAGPGGSHLGPSAVAQLFPAYEGKVLEVRILRLEHIGREASLLLYQLPDDMHRWDAVMESWRRCEESLRCAEGNPDHPNSEMRRTMCRHIREADTHEIACHREHFQVLRAKWLWLHSAVESEMYGFAPHLGRADRGAWPDAPTSSVFPWLEAVHDAAVREAAELRNGRVRFREPIALKTVSEQLSKRLDLIRKKLNNIERLVGGALRNPVAELEDVVECFPEHAETLRGLVRTSRIDSARA